MAIKENKALRDIDVPALQETLLRQGAFIGETVS
jgi:hypothetical protein